MTKRELQRLEYALEQLALGNTGEALFGSCAEAFGGPLDGQMLRMFGSGKCCVTSFANGAPTHHWYELLCYRKGQETSHQYEYMGVGARNEPPCKEGT